MERITGKEVQSMIEAYASVYKNPEVEQEVISEETQQVDEGIADDPRSGVLGQAERLRRKMFGNASERNQAVSYERSIDALTKSRGAGNVRYGKDGKPITADQIAAETKRRRLADPKYKPGQGVDSGAKPGSGGTPSGGTPEVPADRKPKPKPQPRPQPRPQSPSSNLKPGSPNTVVSPKSGEETKFQRRLPTMAELRAAQAARKAATAGGASKKEAEYQAVKAGVGVSKGTVKDPKISADAARKAELERIRSRAASQTKAGVRPTVASTADPKTPPSAAAKSAPKPAGGKEDIFTSTPPGGKPYGNAAKPATSVSTGGAVKTGNVNVPAAKPAPTPTGGAVKTGNVNVPAAKPKTSTPIPSIAGGIEKVADTYVKPNVEKIGAQIGRDRASKMPGGNIPILGDVIKSKGERIGREKAGKLYNKTKTQVKSGDVGGLLKTASEVGKELTQSADLFDIVKGHLMSEGLTEEEALKQMLQLTDEQRTEIIEGSCGSKSKKKKKGGY